MINTITIIIINFLFFVSIYKARCSDNLFDVLIYLAVGISCVISASTFIIARAINNNKSLHQ